MTLTKQTEVDWAFPIIAFDSTGAVQYFDYALPLIEFPQWVVDAGILVGMELIDSAGEQWFVRSIQRIPPEPPQRRWWQFWPFWTEPHAILELGLEKGGEVAFEVVRQRVIDRTIFEAEQSGGSEDLDEEILAEVRRARNFEEIAEPLALPDRVGFFN